MWMKFRLFWKKRRVSSSNFYRNYCVRKRSLLKLLKGIAHHSVINVLTSSKHCWSQHRPNYFPLIPRIQDNVSWKKSALVTSEIFRLFLNTLTPDVKYSRRNIQIFWQQLQKPLSQKRKTFFDFLLHFWNVHEIENILKEKKSILD